MIEYVRRMVDEGRAGVNQICRLFGVSKKSFYYSKSPRERLEERYGHLKEKLTAIIGKHPCYGYRPLQVALRERYGIVVNHKLLRKLLRLWGLGLPRRIRKHKRGVVRRVLDFLEQRANLLFGVKPRECFTVMVSDVTEIVGRFGKAYLAVHLDAVGKSVLGWKLQRRADASLVRHSFNMAIKRIRALLGRVPRMIQHQDRGSVYTSHEYVSTVLTAGLRLSYSRTGEPGDNAVNEAFFARFKEERRDLLGEAQTFEQLHTMVGDAIAYYNRDRYHSTLGYRTPLAFMQDYLTSLPDTG